MTTRRLVAFALVGVSAVRESDENESLVTLEYSKLVAGHDYAATVARAYAHDGLGILAVVGVPDGMVDAPRRRLLTLGRKLALSPPKALAAYEREDLSFANGWSHGREVFRGRPDTTKGSWYAHALEDAPSEGDASAARFPMITGTNRWPTDLVGPDFEASFKELGRVLYDLAAHVLTNADAAVEAANPHAPRGALLNATHGRSRLHVGRLLHYYAPDDNAEPAEPSDAASWCGWHNDNSVITVLPPAMWLVEASGEAVARDACPTGGLMVRTRQGHTVDVVVPPGAVLFQLGEAAQILTGGALMATPHAVRRGAPGLSREAFALFVQPHWDHAIGRDETLHALHTADAKNGDVIPPLSRRLRVLPVEFGRFLSDSYLEYYERSRVAE